MALGLMRPMGYSFVILVLEMRRAHRQIGSSRRGAPSGGVLGWRDAMYRGAMRRLSRRSSDPNWQWRGTGRKGRPRTRWEYPNQDICNAHASACTLWQPIAQDRDAWDAMGIHFAQKYTSTSRGNAEALRGRRMIDHPRWCCTACLAQAKPRSCSMKPHTAHHGG